MPLPPQLQAQPGEEEEEDDDTRDAVYEIKRQVPPTKPQPHRQSVDEEYGDSDEIKKQKALREIKERFNLLSTVNEESLNEKS